MITSRRLQPLAECGCLTGLLCGASLRAGVLRVTGCCMVLCLVAQLKIPVPGTTVPMTLQAPTILAVAFALAPLEAVAATVLYLVLGAAGLPVFAGPGGLTGQTAGFLFGFAGAAWLVSRLKGGGQASVGRLFLSGLAGFLLIFVAGISWMTVQYGGNVWLALYMGLVPFWIKAIVSLAFVVTGVVSIRGTRDLLQARRTANSNV